MNIAISENYTKKSVRQFRTGEIDCAEQQNVGTVSGSINTVRIVTFLQKDLREVSFLFSSVRIGNGGIVDNLNNGGMSSIVDLESGAILFSAADKNGVIYKEHPITHTKIAGFQIPYWNEILQLVASAAREIPEIRYLDGISRLRRKARCLWKATTIPDTIWLKCRVC
jgi:hypothetical protein